MATCGDVLLLQPSVNFTSNWYPTTELIMYHCQLHGTVYGSSTICCPSARLLQYPGGAMHFSTSAPQDLAHQSLVHTEQLPDTIDYNIYAQYMCSNLIRHDILLAPSPLESNQFIQIVPPSSASGANTARYASSTQSLPIDSYNVSAVTSPRIYTEKNGDSYLSSDSYSRILQALPPTNPPVFHMEDSMIAYDQRHAHPNASLTMDHQHHVISYQLPLTTSSNSDYLPNADDSQKKSIVTPAQRPLAKSEHKLKRESTVTPSGPKNEPGNAQNRAENILEMPSPRYRDNKRAYATGEAGQPRCDHCGKVFMRDSNLRAHQDCHNPNRDAPWVCPEEGCGKKFVRRADLQRHIDCVHLRLKRFFCKMCGKYFTRRDIARRHMDDGCQGIRKMNKSDKKRREDTTGLDLLRAAAKHDSEDILQDMKQESDDGSGNSDEEGQGYYDPTGCIIECISANQTPRLAAMTIDSTLRDTPTYRSYSTDNLYYPTAVTHATADTYATAAATTLSPVAAATNFNNFHTFYQRSNC